MLIDQLFPNDTIKESAYGAAAGVETIRQLIHAVKDSKDIDLKVGPEQFPVRYDEARYLLSLWRANMEGGDKTADLFGDVNWVQSKLDDRDYRMGAGKLKDIDQERMKDIQKDKVLNLEYDSHNVGTGQYSDFEVMQAIKIAQDNEDNMTGAIEKIEAIKPGLSDHRAVKHELQKVNENCGKCPVTGEDECHCDERKDEGMMRPMEYKGWKYSAEDEDYDDVIKISHSATKDGKEVSMDWSPYSRPTEKEFKLWIDLGMPTRKDVNSIGPLDNDDLMTLAKTKRGTAGLLQQEDKEEDPIDQSKLDAKTKVALKKAGLKYGAQTKGDPLASLVTFVADKDSEKTQDINRLDHENDEEEADIKAQDLVDKEHTKKLGNNDLQDKYQDQEIERLKQDLQKLLAR